MIKLNNKKGFTLIELMIVIAIIGILAAIAIPNFISYRNKSFCSSAESDANSIAGRAVRLFRYSDPHCAARVYGDESCSGRGWNLNVALSGNNSGAIGGARDRMPSSSPSLMQAADARRSTSDAMQYVLTIRTAGTTSHISSTWV